MIRLHCDRCGRFVTSIGEPKDLSVFKQETICKSCVKSEEKLAKLAEGLKSRWMVQVDELVKEARQEMKDELAKIKASYGKDD